MRHGNRIYGTKIKVGTFKGVYFIELKSNKAQKCDTKYM